MDTSYRVGKVTKDRYGEKMNKIEYIQIVKKTGDI